MSGSALRWRSRRGMKELDVLFERFHQRCYAQAGPELRRQFERLLEREDPEIWDWVLSQRVVPTEFADVIDALRRHD